MTDAPGMPRGSAIRPRHPTFDLDEALSGDWSGGDPFRTAFFNAMSLSFPSGERFFIDAVRAFEDEIREPEVRDAIRGFIGQEAVHRRVHQSYNETFCRRRGYDLGALEAPFLEGVEWGRENVSALGQLAVTVALEHLTATLATTLLDHRFEALAGADPRVAEVWRWHAAEETEHRSVAFDVYSRVGGCPKRLRKTLWPVTVNFLRDNFRAVRTMLRRDGHGEIVFVRGLWHLFVWPGILRRAAPMWAAFLRRGFDPGREGDGEALLALWDPDPALVSFAPVPNHHAGAPDSKPRILS